nr:uncharacterized protein LOC113815905 [Penaeus vannamei]
MKFVIIACVAAVALAAPQYDSSEEFVPILKDDRVHEDDGTFNFDFEAANGIRVSQAGSPDGDEDAVIKAGENTRTPLLTAPPLSSSTWLTRTASSPSPTSCPWLPSSPTRSLSSSSTRSLRPPRRTATAATILTNVTIRQVSQRA